MSRLSPVPRGAIAAPHPIPPHESPGPRPCTGIILPTTGRRHHHVA